MKPGETGHSGKQKIKTEREMQSPGNTPGNLEKVMKESVKEGGGRMKIKEYWFS